MARSGSFYTNVSNRWRVQAEWSSTPNNVANTSSVTVKLYWMGLDQYSAVYATASDPTSITINGSTGGGSATPQLSAYQKKLIQTRTVTVAHNSDGSKSINLSAYFDVNADLNGWISRVHLSDSVTLDTIPRKSTMSSSNANLTATNDKTISISRASTTFNHKLKIYVKNRAGSNSHIKTLSFSSNQTSVSTAFSTADTTQIFDLLDGRDSTGTYMVLETFSGSTEIGSNAYSGTVSAPNATTAAGNFDRYVFINESPHYIPLNRSRSAFTHTVRVKFGTFTKTFTGVSTSVSWAPTTTERNALFAQIPNDTYDTGSLEVETYYNGEQVGSTYSTFYQFYASESESSPTFTSSPTYADINGTTTSITGNSLYVISDKSSVRLSLPAGGATARDGATLKEYVATLGGKSVRKPYSSAAQTFDFGTIKATTNQTALITVVDSRGFSANVAKIVTIIPYTPPAMTPSAERINGFEASTTLKVSGSISTITVGSTAKNTINSLQYRYRKKGVTTWGTYVNFAKSGFPSFLASNVTLSLPNTQAYEIEFKLSDRLSTTTTILTVSSGKPIFFIDDILGSIAMNDYPVDPNTFLVNGRITFAGNLYASAGEGEVGGAIDLNNGDVVGTNGIWFNDLSNNSGEGLLFPKTGTAAKSSNSAEYDNFYIRDQHLFLNNRDFMQVEIGDGAGDLVRIGSGGLTIIGGGESSQSLRDNVPFSYAAEEMYVGSDNDVVISTNHQNGYASRYDWVFQDNGILSRTSYKEGNGFQTLTQRVNANHYDPMLIQDLTDGNVALGSNDKYASANVTFPTAFSETPQWIVVSGRDANAVHASFAVYNATATGCTVYATRLPSTTSSSSYTPNFQIVACGRKT